MPWATLGICSHPGVVCGGLGRVRGGKINYRLGVEDVLGLEKGSYAQGKLLIFICQQK